MNPSPEHTAKRKYLPLVLFGCLLAILMALLHFFEYRYFIGSLSSDIYTSIIATIFTGVGIWIGINLLKKKASDSAPLGEKTTSKPDHSLIEKFELNKREYEILELISKGLSNQKIADELFIALPTVKTHTSNLYSKLGVKSRTEAMYKAQSLNLI